MLNNPYMSPTPRPFNDTTMSVSNFSYSYKSASGISLQSRDEVNQGISVDQGYGDTHWYCGNFATGSCKFLLSTPASSSAKILGEMAQSLSLSTEAEAPQARLFSSGTCSPLTN